MSSIHVFNNQRLIDVPQEPSVDEEQTIKKIHDIFLNLKSLENEVEKNNDPFQKKQFHLILDEIKNQYHQLGGFEGTDQKIFRFVTELGPLVGLGLFLLKLNHILDATRHIIKQTTNQQWSWQSNSGYWRYVRGGSSSYY